LIFNTPPKKISNLILYFSPNVIEFNRENGPQKQNSEKEAEKYKKEQSKGERKNSMMEKDIAD